MSGRLSRPKLSFSDIVKLGPLRLFQRENGAFVPVVQCVTRTGHFQVLTPKNLETTLKEARRIAALSRPDGPCLARHFLEMAGPVARDLAYVAEDMRLQGLAVQKGLRR